MPIQQTGTNDTAGNLAHVTGLVRINNSAPPGGANWVLATTTTTNAEWISINSLIVTAGGSPWLRTSPNVYLAFPTDLVGIGTATPAEKLEVVGNLRLGGYGDTLNAAAPATPSAGYLRWYAKTDKLPYVKDDAGVESPLVGFTASGTGGPWTGVTFKNLDFGQGATGFNTGGGTIKLDSSIPEVYSNGVPFDTMVSRLDFGTNLTLTSGGAGVVVIDAAGGGGGGPWQANGSDPSLIELVLSTNRVTIGPLSYASGTKLTLTPNATASYPGGGTSYINLYSGAPAAGTVSFSPALVPGSAISANAFAGHMVASPSGPMTLSTFSTVVIHESTLGLNTTAVDHWLLYCSGGVYASRFDSSVSTPDIFDNPAAITVTASPFTYTNNTRKNLFVSVQGGTVSAIAILVNGTPVTTGLTQGVFPLRDFAGLRVTYTAAPTMKSWRW